MSKYIDLSEATDLFKGIDATMTGGWVADTLEDLPTIEVSEDCISREYLKSFEYINKGDFNSVETIREWIDNAPSVVPKDHSGKSTEMVGEWIKVSADKYVQHAYHFYRCSECGEDTIGEPNYCPNCGAKMRLE